MSKFCTNCGTKIPDEAMFCSNCGSAVDQRQPQPAYNSPQYAKPQNTPPDVRMVTPSIGLGPDGKYRWIYEMSLFRNPSVFLTVWKIFFFICIGIFVFMMVIQAINGDLDGEAALNMLKVIGIVFGVMTVLVIISFLIYAAIMGGKYIVMFEMDENGIRHKQHPKQAKKAMGIAVTGVIVGMLAKSTSAMAGCLAAANSEMYTSFEKTKKVRFYPKRDTIKLRHTLMHNQVYAMPEDFDFVKNYILERVPDNAKPEV